MRFSRVILSEAVRNVKLLVEITLMIALLDAGETIYRRCPRSRSTSLELNSLTLDHN